MPTARIEGVPLGAKVVRIGYAKRYRLAARAVHPDHGGSAEKFHELQRNMEALR